MTNPAGVVRRILRSNGLGFVIFVVAFASLSGGFFMLATGCAVGRSDTGGIVLGVEAGRIVETTEQGVALVAEWGLTALGIGGTGGIAGISLLLRKLFKSATDAAATRARHEGERAGWDEALGIPPAAGSAAAAPSHTPPGGVSASRVGPTAAGVTP